MHRARGWNIREHVGVDEGRLRLVLVAVVEGLRYSFQDQYSLHDSWRLILILKEDRQCESDFYRGVRHEEVPLCSRERRMREAEVGSQSAGAINF